MEVDVKTSGELLQVDNDEVFYAAHQDGEWHFVPEQISSLFRYVAGDDWTEMIGAPYYREFWEPVVKALEARPRTPVRIMLHCAYDYGTIGESLLHTHMDAWRTSRHTRVKPNMLAVSERDEHDNVTTVHLVIKDFTFESITEL